MNSKQILAVLLVFILVLFLLLNKYTLEGFENIDQSVDTQEGEQGNDAQFGSRAAAHRRGALPRRFADWSTATASTVPAEPKRWRWPGGHSDQTIWPPIPNGRGRLASGQPVYKRASAGKRRRNSVFDWCLREI